MVTKPFSLILRDARGLYACVSMAALAGTAVVVVAAPNVEFDFARAIACVDVTRMSSVGDYANLRLVQLTLPVSVRFHGLTMDDVEEIDIEINGAAHGLRVYDFAPSTQLASDVARPIETTTTTKRARSLEGTLGGALPVPYAEVVAHVSPSINAGISGSEVATEKMNRLPPKRAVVVSGTSSEGRGVFFKLKQSSQTSLEGVHGLSVTFVVPAGWRGGEVQIACSARGQRRVLWIKQAATVGEETGTVRLHLTGTTPVYHVAKPVAVEPVVKVEPASTVTEAEHESAELRNSSRSHRERKEPPIEDGAKAGL
jgi:hypothetical protein